MLNTFASIIRCEIPLVWAGRSCLPALRTKNCIGLWILAWPPACRPCTLSELYALLSLRAGSRPVGLGSTSRRRGWKRVRRGYRSVGLMVRRRRKIKLIPDQSSSACSAGKPLIQSFDSLKSRSKALVLLLDLLMLSNKRTKGFID